MTTLTIRNIDMELKARLRVQAAGHGRSMEEEVRQILRASLNPPSPAAQEPTGALLPKPSAACSRPWAGSTFPPRPTSRQRISSTSPDRRPGQC